jgi:ribosome biogenesis GTPase
MNLEEIGWASYRPADVSHQFYGRVALANREHFVVWMEHGEVEATISGHFRHTCLEFPGVGDWVEVREGNVITAVLPRKTKLSRKEPGKGVREQMLAANMEVLFIVSGLDRDYNPRRLERYLVLAYESGARPVILLNKADLHVDRTQFMAETEQSAPGVPVFPVSALRGWGLDAIARHMNAGETAALIGSSGAGKSTILNRLLGRELQTTTPVRESDSKGRHTTTQRQLVRMPGGWLLMDLPGLRELQLWADPEQIDGTFSEISDLAQGCKFRDCTHQHEPGCAVRDAEIDEDRLASYTKLQRELAYLDRDSDPHRARANRKKWNALEKNMRLHPKRMR